MKTKLKYLLALAYLANTLPSLAAKETHTSSITVFGVVEPNIYSKEEFKAYFVPEYLHAHFEGVREMKVAVTKEGRFSLQIKDVTKPGKLNIYLNSNHYYLVYPGDSVEFKISGSKEAPKFAFSGPGADKFACRAKIELVLREWSIARKKATFSVNRIAGIDSTSAQDRYHLFFDIKHLGVLFAPYIPALQKIKEAISNHKLNLDKAAEQVLLADALGRMGYSWTLELNHFLEKMDFTLPSEAQKADSLLTNYTKYFDEPFPDSILRMSQSATHGYVNYLMNKTLLEISVATKYKGYTLGDLYTCIEFSFSGYIRERLLSFLFISPFYKRKDRKDLPREFEQYGDRLLQTLHDSALKTIVGRVMSRSIGRIAYNFALPDINGDTVKLSDFKGKVVLIDIWFAGCTGCRLFANQFKKEIYPLFRDNEEFVVVSINTDSKRERWMNALKSGLYTEKEYVNVYSGEKGFYGNTLVEYYYITAAPFVLIIDKEGKIFSEVVFLNRSDEIKTRIQEALGKS